MKKTHWTLGLVLTVGLAACSDSGTAPEPPVEQQVATSIVISGGSRLLESIGQQVTFQAQVLDQKGVAMPSAAVTWETSDAAILSVVSPGSYRSAGNGTATVRARTGSIVGEAAVTVNQRATALRLTAAQNRFWAIGQRRALTASAVDAAGTAMVRAVPLTWTSSNTGIVRVDGSGSATSVADGTATITVSGEGLSATTELTVAATVQYQTCFTVAGLPGSSASSAERCVSVSVVVRENGSGS